MEVSFPGLLERESAKINREPVALLPHHQAVFVGAAPVTILTSQQALGGVCEFVRCEDCHTLII